jgi:hypothetical protein
LNAILILHQRLATALQARARRLNARIIDADVSGVGEHRFKPPTRRTESQPAPTPSAPPSSACPAGANIRRLPDFSI